MTHERQQLGLAGERIAARWMILCGWQLVTHRFRHGHRDIDLIMRSGCRVVFVEVKARRGAIFGSPVEAVNARKRRELVRSARVWIDRHGTEGSEYRLDVIGILISGQSVRIRHVENAFSVS